MVVTASQSQATRRKSRCWRRGGGFEFSRLRWRRSWRAHSLRGACPPPTIARTGAISTTSPRFVVDDQSSGGERELADACVSRRQQELRNISREQGLAGAMPETKLLKELGYRSLVHAIRKKHGGVTVVAQKIGFAVAANALEEGKRVQARAKRREKRNTRIAQHDFY
jgi:hypothetical protein